MFSCMLQQIDKALNPKKENLKEIEKKWLTLQIPILIMMKKTKKNKNENNILKKAKKDYLKKNWI